MENEMKGGVVLYSKGGFEENPALKNGKTGVGGELGAQKPYSLN